VALRRRRRPWRRPAPPAAPGPSRPPRAGTAPSASLGRPPAGTSSSPALLASPSPAELWARLGALGSGLGLRETSPSGASLCLSNVYARAIFSRPPRPPLSFARRQLSARSGSRRPAAGLHRPPLPHRAAAGAPWRSWRRALRPSPRRTAAAAAALVAPPPAPPPARPPPAAALAFRGLGRVQESAHSNRPAFSGELWCLASCVVLRGTPALRAARHPAQDKC
jgi:hypothetical protein